MDFGSSAADYARYRAGFPPSFFERVGLRGKILDLGSGTGTLARGFLERGAEAVALDFSQGMLTAASGIAMRVAARAEAAPFADGTFDAVTAGQCWHWFDGIKAATEARRVLKPAGSLVIAHFDYIAQAGNVAGATEELVLRFNPEWTMARGIGIYEVWRPHFEQTGFETIESFWYDEDVVYTHESWRGRFRACNGVLTLGDKIEAFDADLAKMLSAGWPEPLHVPHRIFVIRGVKP